MSRATHLTMRFFGSLRAREPDAGDELWVKLILSSDELAVWSAMSRADKAESVAVARRVATALGRDAEPDYLAAALLHDVGKTEAHLGTFRRVGATSLALMLSKGRVRRWANGVGRYIAHDEIGSRMLKDAGARPVAVAWAAAHHRPEAWATSGIPPEMCEILAVADGER